MRLTSPSPPPPSVLAFPSSRLPVPVAVSHSSCSPSLRRRVPVLVVVSFSLPPSLLPAFAGRRRRVPFLAFAVSCRRVPSPCPRPRGRFPFPPSLSLSLRLPVAVVVSLPRVRRVLSPCPRPCGRFDSSFPPSFPAFPSAHPRCRICRALILVFLSSWGPIHLSPPLPAFLRRTCLVFLSRFFEFPAGFNDLSF